MRSPRRIGILGGGQLGRMLALSAYPLGISCLVLDPHIESPAGQVTQQLVAPLDDPRALQLLAGAVDLVTYETENVPTTAVRRLEKLVPVRPLVHALETAGDRLREKELFRDLQIPTPRWACIHSLDDLQRALEELGPPLVLKTRRCGYDGKGQFRIQNWAEASQSWEILGGVPCIAERQVRFSRELSVVAVRGLQGETAFYPLVENHHEQGILRLSLAPAPGLSLQLSQRARDYAQQVLEALNYVGVLALEFFEVDGELLANEIAPRVHNSGHWTLEGARTSQFENHLRAISGLPLGSTQPLGCSAMVNLIGELPDLRAVENSPGAAVHLYGKMAVPGRKLGHVTITADHPQALGERLNRIQGCLPIPRQTGHFLRDLLPS